MRLLSFSIIFFLFAFFTKAHAAGTSFSDVSSSREEYQAVVDLKSRRILEGRPDGTFGPDDFVNRAEAITVVVRAVANVENLPPFDACFPDVFGDIWYVQPVCYAQDLGWVSGYPDGTFQPVRTVAKAEFLKILFNAYGVDTDTVQDLRDSLAPDAKDPDEWYFPFLSLSLARSMTSADSFGNLNPGAALTRGQVALLMHRFLLYREGQRTQELLNFAEKDIRAVFSSIDALDIDNARFAAARVNLSAWGALQRMPDSDVVRVTTKLGEALRTLAEAYHLVKQHAVEDALAGAKRAYQLADETDSVNGSASIYTTRVRTYAHDLAEDIREFMEEE